MDLASRIEPGGAMTTLSHALNIQMTYGAVMLSLLIALQWGFQFAGYGKYKRYSHHFIGAAPVVFGCPRSDCSP